MINIIRASIFKLLRDWTFRITMIVGLGLAALLLLVNGLLDLLNGQSLFISCVAPTQNYGLTVPINLIVFTVSEFTFGTIRNKIIAGHPKFKVYIGLFLTGLIFTFSLMIMYATLMIGIGSAVGGFDASVIGGWKFCLFYTAYFVVTYVFITAFSIFFGTLFRTIGGSISIVVVALVMLGMIPLFVQMASMDLEVNQVMLWLDPLYLFMYYGYFATPTAYELKANVVAGGIVVPLYWAIIFFVSGAFIFIKRDVK